MSIVSVLDEFERNNGIDSNILLMEKELRYILDKGLYLNNEYEKYIARVDNLVYGDFDIESNREAIIFLLDYLNRFKNGDKSTKSQIESLFRDKLESSHQYFSKDWYCRPTIVFNNRFIWKYFSEVGVFDNQINMDYSTYDSIFDTAYSEYINENSIENLTIESDEFIYKMKRSDIDQIEEVLSKKRVQLLEEYPFQIELMEFLVKKFKEGKSVSYSLPEY